jgi:hypothetical protein
MIKPILLIRFYNIVVADQKLYENVITLIEKKYPEYYVMSRVYADEKPYPDIEVLNPSDKLKELDLNEVLDYLEKIKQNG